MRVISTICSRAKRTDEELLPAGERYTAEHVIKVKKIAEQEKAPFFILSGKYGFISSEQKIPNYDYYLEDEKVDSLAELVSNQIKEHGITEIDFYSEQKDSWKPYSEALRKGADLAKIKLRLNLKYL